MCSRSAVKTGRPAEKAAHDGESGFQNGQSERHDRYGHRKQCGRLLCALQSERAQHESDEKASAISQEDGRRAEIKTEKAQNRSRQRQRHERNQRRT